PINTAAYGTLRNEQIGNASGLFNLMRNVGGSIGISLASTLLVRRADVHQNLITNSVPQTGQNFQNALSNTTHAVSSYFGHANASGPGAALLYQQLLKQATAWAFVDVFRWLSLLSFFCIIFVWLFKKVKPGRGPAGAH
ncbi:MAG TPA: EmrB/QacA family drug resistance transporter, partial [Edaphobacter sp.]|nr:EmrB/QacA family drug resistance transporter [Edaphobacter sp.]